ncbi:MAG: hypothetical protein MZU97_24905 [Bacillus subtilis]|nr:hypothetical protein [Bacillus subtilis]
MPIIESLNAMQFDAFVLGNHEFDWGIDKIANYKDGNPGEWRSRLSVPSREHRQ